MKAVFLLPLLIFFFIYKYLIELNPFLNKDEANVYL